MDDVRIKLSDVLLPGVIISLVLIVLSLIFQFIVNNAVIAWQFKIFSPTGLATIVGFILIFVSFVISLIGAAFIKKNPTINLEE